MALIKVAGIVRESIVDGPGYRYVLFTQGCPHGCVGCHNPQTHDFNGGYWLDTKDILAEITANPLLDGVTFSGGEPFCQAEGLVAMVDEIKGLGLNLVIFTGYTWERLCKMDAPYIQQLLHSADILIDGPFLEEFKDLTLNFRGSTNQRIIDVPKSFRMGKIVEMVL